MNKYLLYLLSIAMICSTALSIKAVDEKEETKHTEFTINTKVSIENRTLYEFQEEIDKGRTTSAFALIFGAGSGFFCAAVEPDITIIPYIKIFYLLLWGKAERLAIDVIDYQNQTIRHHKEIVNSASWLTYLITRICMP